MTQIKKRGNLYAVIYYFKPTIKSSKSIPQWESYKSEDEAIQRKTLIECLKKNKRHDEVARLALEYRECSKKQGQFLTDGNYKLLENLGKTYGEFVSEWLPIHTQKQRLQPGSYDSINGLLKKHILPYFGEFIICEITEEDIDKFGQHLSQKRCSGSKSYGKNPDEIPTLSSSTIRKVFDVLVSSFADAKRWEYSKRKYWSDDDVKNILGKMDNDLLHLAVHLAFVASLRCGETVGLSINSISSEEKCIEISQTLQRVSDVALQTVPTDGIIRSFPKENPQAKSRLILKLPKTNSSLRRIYLTAPLLEEIEKRLAQIERDKSFYKTTYHDYNLLLCKPNGDPIETRLLEKWFKNWQKTNDIEPMIEFQGLRKSSSMYKLKISDNDYKTVQGDTGHSTAAVLMEHYNEIEDKSRKKLIQKMENNFYVSSENKDRQLTEAINTLIEALNFFNSQT